LGGEARWREDEPGRRKAQYRGKAREYSFGKAESLDFLGKAPRTVGEGGTALCTGDFRRGGPFKSAARGESYRGANLCHVKHV